MAESLPGMYVPQDLLGSLKAISDHLSMSVRWVQGLPSSTILVSVQASVVPLREHAPWGLGEKDSLLEEGVPGGQAGEEEVLTQQGAATTHAGHPGAHLAVFLSNYA